MMSSADGDMEGEDSLEAFFAGRGKKGGADDLTFFAGRG